MLDRIIFMFKRDNKHFEIDKERSVNSYPIGPGKDILKKILIGIRNILMEYKVLSHLVADFF